MNAVVEALQRIIGQAGAPDTAFDWDESKHPRGNPKNAGQFSKAVSSERNDKKATEEPELNRGRDIASYHGRNDSKKSRGSSMGGSEETFGEVGIFGITDPWVKMWTVKSLPEDAKRWVGEHFNSISKSPYGDSFYDSNDISWDHKPDGSLRLADHWNFSSGYDSETHCKTSGEVDNIKEWAVGRWNAGRGEYDILKRWPSEGEYVPTPDIRNGHRYPHMKVKSAKTELSEAVGALSRKASANYSFAEHRVSKPVRYAFNHVTGKLREVE